MPDIKPRPEDLPKETSHPQEKAQTDITDKRARMMFHIVGKPAEPFSGQRHTQEGVRLQPLADIAVLDLVLYIPGNDAAEKNKNTRITGIEQREALPGMLIPQHVHRSSA